MMEAFFIPLSLAFVIAFIQSLAQIIRCISFSLFGVLQAETPHVKQRKARLPRQRQKGKEEILRRDIFDNKWGSIVSVSCESRKKHALFVTVSQDSASFALETCRWAVPQSPTSAPLICRSGTRNSNGNCQTWRELSPPQSGVVKQAVNYAIRTMVPRSRPERIAIPRLEDVLMDSRLI